MKQIACSLLAFAMLTSSLYGEERDRNTANYYTNRYNNASADATTTAIGVSMLSWGVGIAAVVAALTILIPPDNESSGHTHCDPGD